MRVCLCGRRVNQGQRLPCDTCRLPYTQKAYRAYRAWVKASNLPCHLCGALGANTVDHITPLSRGGRNDSTNWAPAHASCNYSKGAG